MIHYYPRLTGTYMSDELFINAGQFTGTSTVIQRQFAYGMAESSLEQEIGTFVSPTTITGTYPFVAPNKVLDLGAGKLISVNSVTFYEKYSNGVDRLISGTARVVDYNNSYVMVDVSTNDNSSCGGCAGQNNGIYKVDISFTAGYQTGQMVNNPTLIIPLAMTSTMFLNLLMDEAFAQDDYAYNTTTQIGRSIRTVANKFAKDGSLGSGQKANFIRSLIRPLVIVKAGKLG